MSLRSVSAKLYLAIAVMALVMWFVGVAGGTILTLAAIGFMVAMHAGGHSGHGGRPHEADAHRHDANLPAGHNGRASDASSTGASTANTETAVQHKPRGGCR